MTVEVAKAKSEKQHDKDGKLRETGVYDLRLFRDGQIVGQYGDGRPRVLHPSASGHENLLAWRGENEIHLDGNGKRIIKFENIKLPRKADTKQVEFSAYAFSEDRVKSHTDRVSFDLPAGLSPLKGRAYIVMFGVNACEAECRSLEYAVNDVREMQATFIDKLRESGQYDEVIGVPLIADYTLQSGGKRIVVEKSATKGNLKAVLDLLSGKPVDQTLLGGLPNAARLRPARPEDMVMIFFSSHGDTDGHGNFYIVPYDIGQTRLCGNKAITDEDYRQVLARCISSEELSLWLRYVDAGEMIMIVDACHAAASVESVEFKPGPMGSRGLGQLAYDKRMKVLAATQSDNAAREFKELDQSALSYVLTQEGIVEGRADFRPVDQIVTVTEWLLYGVERVPELYKALQQKRAKRLVQEKAIDQMQQPVLFDFSRKRFDFVLFRKRASNK